LSHVYNYIAIVFYLAAICYCSDLVTLQNYQTGQLQLQLCYRWASKTKMAGPKKRIPSY